MTRTLDEVRHQATVVAVRPAGVFKTARQLGLRQKYYNGLLEVLAKLEAGWFDMVPARIQRIDTPRGFSMSTLWQTSECGSVGCISGWGLMFGYGFVDCQEDGTTLYSASNRQYDAHDRLMCPPQWGQGKYTPAQSAQALRTYLETGSPDWGGGKN